MLMNNFSKLIFIDYKVYKNNWITFLFDDNVSIILISLLKIQNLQGDLLDFKNDIMIIHSHLNQLDCNYYFY